MKAWRKLERALVALFALALNAGCCVAGAAVWESGELAYPSGEEELSAFIDLPGDTQLQVVLCTRHEAYEYRYTLLLPRAVSTAQLLQVKLTADSQQRSVFAELSGNSLDLQIDAELAALLADSPDLELDFTPEQAELLGLPGQLVIPMAGASLTMRRVAGECTARCQEAQGYACNAPLLSGVLWPRDFFRGEEETEVDRLCTSAVTGGYRFNLSEGCKLALDRFYVRAGKGPLSFLSALFSDSLSSYARYAGRWNELVELAPHGAVNPEVYVRGDEEWYLLLYALAGRRAVHDFPQSYEAIRHGEGDATTLIYDVDSRYELETLKYAAVLNRRLNRSVTAMAALNEALTAWGEFYREMVSLLPAIRQAQSFRVLAYRAMLLRLWRLAGSPQGLTLLPEHAFIQGRGGHTASDEPLERQCSIFDGPDAEQFFLGSKECVTGTRALLRAYGMVTPGLELCEQRWDSFATRWRASDLYRDSLDDAAGAQPGGKLSLALLTLARTYGFGDYFVLRQCISSRDADICGFERTKIRESLRHDLEQRLTTLGAGAEAGELRELSALWEAYAEALHSYVQELVELRRLSPWRAALCEGVAAAVQDAALLSLGGLGPEAEE